MRFSNLYVLFMSALLLAYTDLVSSLSDSEITTPDAQENEATKELPTDHLLSGKEFEDRLLGGDAAVGKLVQPLTEAFDVLKAGALVTNGHVDQRYRPLAADVVEKYKHHRSQPITDRQKASLRVHRAFGPSPDFIWKAHALRTKTERSLGRYRSAVRISMAKRSVKASKLAEQLEQMQFYSWYMNFGTDREKLLKALGQDPAHMVHSINKGRLEAILADYDKFCNDMVSAGRLQKKSNE
uniref:RxLR effector protein n=1 Tax=Peronospora matthiolae TaxID=2874970 RepID=A0AAV1UNX0_9STRA